MSTDERLLICRQLDEAETRADKAEQKWAKAVVDMNAIDGCWEKKCEALTQQLAKVNGWREDLKRKLRESNDKFAAVTDAALQYKQQLAAVEDERNKATQAALLSHSKAATLWLERDTVQQQLAQAQAKAAEMRGVLTDLLEHNSFNREVCKHALSTSCGSDMIPVTELDKTIELFQSLQFRLGDIDSVHAEITRLQTLRAKGTK